MASCSGSAASAEAGTGAAAQASLTFRGIMMNGQEHTLSASPEQSVGELSRLFAEEIGVEPPNSVSLVQGTTVLGPRRPVGELFVAGEAGRTDVTGGSRKAAAIDGFTEQWRGKPRDGAGEDGQYAARELLEAAIDGNEELFLALLEGGAAVTATMSEKDLRGFYAIYPWRRVGLELRPGATALHVAAVRGWPDGCRRALRAPGGAAAALEAERGDVRGTLRTLTVRQHLAWRLGVDEHSPQVAEVFGAA